MNDLRSVLAEVAVALGTEEGLTDAAGESAETSEISAKSEAAPAATQKPAATPQPQCLQVFVDSGIFHLRRTLR